MSDKKYWQSFGELHQTESFVAANQHEFKEELLPLSDLDDKACWMQRRPAETF